jgi:hypothetical protein
MDVREGGLTPDIPLGPFEGALIPVYTAGKAARLHARPDCPRLQADHASEVKVPLEAASIKRMCAECARRGGWAPPGTALGMYLENFSGYGLADQLDSYSGPDPDDPVSDKEIADAAALLRCGEYPASEGTGDAGEEADEDQWDAFRAARELRESRVVPEWCSAADSLMDAAGKVARYPWLGPWAGKRLDLKSTYAEVLRRQAAQLLNPGAMVAACGAHRMPVPELPVDDPALAVLGSDSDVHRALRSLWREWHLQVSHGWLIPREYDFLAYKLGERLGNKRKGRDQLDERARELLDGWADAAVAAMGHEEQADQLVVASIPVADKERDGRRPPLIKQLTKWELGVLIMFTVAADWRTRTFLLQVPQAIAERMLAADSAMSWVRCMGDPDNQMANADLLAVSGEARLAEAGHSAFLPGILDDTPVSQRRAVTLSEVRALREALDERRQLFVVCSVANGVEILPLALVEQRCKTGWSGVLVAEAGDLPSSLFAPQLSAHTANSADDENGDDPASVWDDRNLPCEHPEFGEHLGGAAGERKLRWMHSRRDDARLLERDFRIYTLARGVHDLRTLDYESDPRIPAVSGNVWLALLLVRDHLSLQPFWPRGTEDAWNSGLGLPLAVLADLQVYTTNADPRIAGKGHSPFCQHVRDRGVRRDDFLLTLEEIMRRSDLDWCSNCGGYAIRRLNDEQISYYRAAHRLLDIDQALTRELDGRASQQADLTDTGAAFDQISQWLHGDHERWQEGDTWRVQDVMRELKDKADRLARYRRDGWPDSGSVVQLKPKR